MVITNAEGNLFLMAPGVWDSAGNSGAELTISNAAALTAPTGLLAADARSEYREEFRERQPGGGWRLKTT